MRRAAIAAVLLVGAGIVTLDITTPFGEITRGSVYTLPRTAMELLPPPSPCSEPCPLRYAFKPNASITVWLSVRNGASLPLTIDGASRTWLGKFDAPMPLRPSDILDGGDPRDADGTTVLSDVAFGSAVLAPSRERMLGFMFQTTDLRYACANLAPGTAIGLDAVPVAWHWGVMSHETRIGFLRPFQIAAPTAAECSGL
jgi:hypothetical protein